MAVTVPNPLFIKNASVKIGTVEYADLINNVVLTPTSADVTFKGISGKTFSSTGAEEWTLQFDYQQDWTSADSLALKLFNSAGTNAVFIITPAAGGPKVTIEATLKAGSMGGAEGAAATSSVTLPCTGRPVLAAGV